MSISMSRATKVYFLLVVILVFMFDDIKSSKSGTKKNTFKHKLSIPLFIENYVNTLYVVKFQLNDLALDKVHFKWQSQ